MIERRNVGKFFWTGKRHKIILNNASFRVALGLSLGILASNGAGKTTLINMIAGFEEPDEGQITRACNISFPLGFMGTKQLIARIYPKQSSKLFKTRTSSVTKVA